MPNYDKEIELLAMNPHEFSPVVISGNSGNGKSTFLHKSRVITISMMRLPTEKRLRKAKKPKSQSFQGFSGMVRATGKRGENG